MWISTAPFYELVLIYSTYEITGSLILVLIKVTIYWVLPRCQALFVDYLHTSEKWLLSPFSDILLVPISSLSSFRRTKTFFTLFSPSLASPVPHMNQPKGCCSFQLRRSKLVGSSVICVSLCSLLSFSSMFCGCLVCARHCYKGK
jgi:hypothetical protein